MALDPITAGIDLANTVVNKLWPDKSEQERAQLAAAVSLVQGQLEINKVEAGSSSVLVAGWRPSIGWACCAALAWDNVLKPMVLTAYVIAGHMAPALPTLTSDQLYSLLFGLLGLGGLRTFEKVKGVS